MFMRVWNKFPATAKALLGLFAHYGYWKDASKATLLLTKTFLNEDKNGNKRSSDPKRLRMSQMFIDQMLNKGLKGGALMPHEIVRKILNNRTISRAEELVLDAQWKDLWITVVDEVKAKAEADGSNFDPTRITHSARNVTHWLTSRPERACRTSCIFEDVLLLI
jgi:hypothetical protein